MTTTYKVLGQVLSTAATASVVDNLILDPTFEWDTNNSYGYAYGASNTYGYARLGLNGGSSPGSSTLTSGTSPWFAISPSSNTSNYTYISVVSSGASGASGSKYLRHYGTGGQNGWIGYGHNPNDTSFSGGAADRIPVLPSTTYYFGFNVASSSAGNHSCQVNLGQYGSDGAYITQSTIMSSFNPGNTNVFERRTASFTTGANTYYIGFGVYNSNYSYYFYYDGFSLATNTNLYSTFKDTLTDSVTYPGNQTYTSPFNNRILGYEGTTYRSRLIKSYASAMTDLYTVPASTQTVCSTITVSNGGNEDATYRIAVIPSGETIAMKHFIAFDHTAAAKSTTAMTFGVTLNAGDKIMVQSDNANVSFSVFGSETV